MERMILDHWFVGRDELEISLMNFYVNIKIRSILDDLVFDVKIINGNMEYILLTFNGLGEAVSFTENVVRHCYDFDEILEVYNEYLDKRRLTLN